MSSKEQIENGEAKIATLIKFKNKINSTYSTSKEDLEIFKNANREYKALVFNTKVDTIEFLEYKDANSKYEFIIPMTHLQGGINNCNLYIDNWIRQINMGLNNLRRKIK